MDGTPGTGSRNGLLSRKASSIGVSTLKPSRNHRDFDAVAQGIVIGNAEGYLQIVAVGCFANNGAGFVDLVQPQRAGASDIDQNAL